MWSRIHSRRFRRYCLFRWGVLALPEATAPYGHFRRALRGTLKAPWAGDSRAGLLLQNRETARSGHSEGASTSAVSFDHLVGRRAKQHFGRESPPPRGDDRTWRLRLMDSSEKLGSECMIDGKRVFKVSRLAPPSEFYRYRTAHGAETAP